MTVARIRGLRSNNATVIDVATQRRHSLKSAAFNYGRTRDLELGRGDQNLLKSLPTLRVKGIRPVGLARFVTPMFIHPEPWRRISPHIRLERIPTGLGDLLKRHVGRVLDFRVKYYSVAPVGQRFAVRWKNWHARLLV